jgi:hypothetical protein
MSAAPAAPPRVTATVATDCARPPLRRADWRFLLPVAPETTFTHTVLCGGPPGLGARLLEAGFTKQISDRLPAQQLADAVILLDGVATRATLRAAARALAPGGVLYCEIDRRRRANVSLSPARLRRLLRELGLDHSGLFWPLPNFGASTRYVPVDTPGAFRWYASTLHTAGTSWRHALKDGLRLATRGYRGAAVTRLLPWYAVTAVSGGSDRRAVILRNPAYPPTLQHSAPQPLLLTSGQDDGSRVIVLPFDAHSKRPLAALKVARLAAFNTNIEGEQDTLACLRAQLDPALAGSIPTPLGTYRHGALAVGIESYAQGQSLFDANIRWHTSAADAIANLRLAADWLTSMHRQTQSTAESGVAALRERAAAVFARYARGFGTTEREQELFSEALATTAALTSQALPFVRQHNDFGPWNIYRHASQLTVIDWELGWGPGFDSHGPPVCDLLYLITHWSYSARRLFTPQAELRGFRELFLTPAAADEYVAAARQVLDDYLAALAIDRRLLPLLLSYTWAERAVKRLDRKQLLGDSSGTPRVGDRFVAYVELLAGERCVTVAGRPSACNRP